MNIGGRKRPHEIGKRGGREGSSALVQSFTVDQAFDGDIDSPKAKCKKAKEQGQNTKGPSQKGRAKVVRCVVKGGNLFRYISGLGICHIQREKKTSV